MCKALPELCLDGLLKFVSCTFFIDAVSFLREDEYSFHKQKCFIISFFHSSSRKDEILKKVFLNGPLLHSAYFLNGIRQRERFNHIVMINITSNSIVMCLCNNVLFCINANGFFFISLEL